MIGTDLDGAILNPGDWIQISNHGGDGSGVGANGGAPDLQWVTIGGDLLAKARADRLFGLQPWTAGGWEQGSLVVYQGDVYRAVRPVTGQDGDPLPQGGGVQIPLVGTPDLLTVTGGALDTLTAPPATGSGTVVTATGANVFPGGPFINAAYTNGDSWVYSDSPYLSGTGTTADGYRYDSGWVAIGQTSPIPDPFVVTMPAGASPWAVVDISGGLKVAADMAGLPMTAPPGQVWIVLAGAGGKQELYSYDGGAQQWQELGGGGTPMDLSGGLVVYPRTLFVDGQPPADLSVAPTPQPKVVGDTLWSRTSNAHPVCLAMSTDGSTWNRYHPQRLVASITGAGRPGSC